MVSTQEWIEFHLGRKMTPDGLIAWKAADAIHTLASNNAGSLPDSIRIISDAIAEARVVEDQEVGWLGT